MRTRFAITLLYPIGAAIYIATAVPANYVMVVGYAVANLGYLLYAAGIFGGSFRVLGLRNRWQVIGAAIISLVAGTMLSNIAS